MERQYSQHKSQKHWRKRKDQGNMIIITIITMTRTMTEIDDTAEVGHTVKIDHETTTEMTIERKLLGDPKLET